jgi:hypothetical protein
VRGSWGRQQLPRRGDVGEPAREVGREGAGARRRWGARELGAREVGPREARRSWRNPGAAQVRRTLRRRLWRNPRNPREAAQVSVMEKWLAAGSMRGHKGKQKARDG